MKPSKLKTINKYFLCMVLVAVALGCDGGTSRNETTDKYVTVVIEGCDYIYHESVGYKGLVHKGNCRNEIHKCNCH